MAQKDVGVAYLLWFFLGWAGGHRFYVGRKGTAITQLVLDILGWVTFWIFGFGVVFWIALGIWLFVDLFLIPGMVRATQQPQRNLL